jgi:hypothetical protein
MDWPVFLYSMSAAFNTRVQAKKNTPMEKPQMSSFFAAGTRDAESLFVS